MIPDRPTILIVEDDLDISETLAEIVEAHGHRAVLAGNGREALDLLRARAVRPCLILLDLMMPVMDGRAFREEQLRDAELASIPVVVLSAYRSIEDVVEEMKVSAYLRKPLDREALLGMARRYCAPSA